MDTAVNKMNRRQFIGSTGLSIGVALQFGSRSTEAQAAGTTTQQVNSWLNIGSDNSVSLTIGVTEMGQGTFSTLGQIMAEDLMVDYGRRQAEVGVIRAVFVETQLELALRWAERRAEAARGLSPLGRLDTRAPDHEAQVPELRRQKATLFQAPGVLASPPLLDR